MRPFNVLWYSLRAAIAAFTPASLFGASEPGVFFDNDDLTAFFSDSAMTTQADVNGLVGGQSDKSGNGKHRTQATTGSKPILRGSPAGSQLVTSGDFASGTGWTTGAGWAIGSGVATAATSSGTLTSTLAAVSGKVYRITYTVTRSAGSVQPSFGGVNLTSRAAAGTFLQYITASSTAALVFTGTAFIGTIDNVEVYDVSAGSVQAPYGLQYDGVDDWMSTAAIDFSVTSKMFVCAGVTKLSDVSDGSLVELSANTNTNAGSFYVWAPEISSSLRYASISRGSAGASISQRASSANSAHIAPVTNVVSAIHDIPGDSSILRVNAVAMATATGDKGSGNFGNYVMYFGRRGGATIPYNGIDFGMTIIGRTLTAGELSDTETFHAGRSGATL